MSNVLAPSAGSTFSQRTWFILKAWLRNPIQVATIFPSSPFLTKQLADRDCIRTADRVIELGPGAGGTTAAMLSQMHSDAKMLTIEKTESFAEPLNAIQDPRLSICMADAMDLRDIAREENFGKTDVLISGIPFSLLPPEVAMRISQSIYQVLRPGGVFIAYQMKSDVKEYAEPLFGPPVTEPIPMNVPPLNAFVWEKVENDDCCPQAAIPLNT